MLLRCICALAILAVAGAFVFLLLRARAIKARHLRVLRGEAPSLESLGLFGARLFQSDAALFHGTGFADGAALLIPWLRAPCAGDLFCTEQALFLRREPLSPEVERHPVLCWPLDSIDQASLHRGFAPLAGKELPLLRLRWKQGGEELVSALSLRGGMEQLERLRREIHLRQGKGALLVQLGKLLAPPAG